VSSFCCLSVVLLIFDFCCFVLVTFKISVTPTHGAPVGLLSHIVKDMRRPVPFWFRLGILVSTLWPVAAAAASEE